MQQPRYTPQALDHNEPHTLAYRLNALPLDGFRLERLPYSIRVLLENAVRTCALGQADERCVEALAFWGPDRIGEEIVFAPARVVMQDFTGVPAVADLAAMRDAMAAAGGDPARINPLVPVDLIIDHSLQVDEAGRSDAVRANVQREFERNHERYAFLKWAQSAFTNLRIVPPGTGIIHQINLEYIAPLVHVMTTEQGDLVYPDTVVGTDSHTTMINGLGVPGWGVGGIEAEAAMLGQPIVMAVPEVIGCRLTGSLRPGVTATDLVLTVTQALRQRGVVGRIVEFFGDGAVKLPVADRAVIANMAPEYGATMGYFPVDAETFAFLRLTGRPEPTVALAERYFRAQGMYREADAPEPEYSDIVVIDLSTIEPSLAGPKRPQDRVPLRAMPQRFTEALTAPVAERGYGLADDAAAQPVAGADYSLRHGDVVIASITSCTNTSNPSVMVGAGLLARNAVQRGLVAKDWVRCSLAPGSRAVTEYLAAAGVLESLEALRFHVVGYGCATCIGNSGPLDASIAEAIEQGGVVAASVLSGNRNFEGRVNPHTRANYLASPMLVVAYALAGSVRIDLNTDPLGCDASGKPVYLRDIWPSDAEISDTVAKVVSKSLYASAYASVFEGSEEWRNLDSPAGELYQWDRTSTYIQAPPFCETRPVSFRLDGARVLAVFGDSITTDHISPAGSIAMDSPAGRYLQELGVSPRDFNSYGSRRGNHHVMMRGTFANIRLKNLMTPGVEGGVTRHQPSGDTMSIYDAAMRYAAEGVPLVVIAGREYGTGSSRDWAAKGPALLGVRAVLAQSFERIHRSNLVGMGILPLQFLDGQSAASLGLDGSEQLDLLPDSEPAAGMRFTVVARSAKGTVRFTALARIDTPAEVTYLLSGGILPMIVQRLSAGS